MIIIAIASSYMLGINDRKSLLIAIAIAKLLLVKVMIKILMTPEPEGYTDRINLNSL